MGDAGPVAAAWFAAHLRPNTERLTESYLAGREVETFLPTYLTPRRGTGSHDPLVRPLFPGYIFVRLAPADPRRLAVLQAPGVVRLVGFGDHPAVVPDETIGSLRILVAAGGDAVRPHPLVQVGRAVRIVQGPFAGAAGILARGHGRKPRLVVNVEFLGRAVAVPVALADLAAELRC